MATTDDGPTDEPAGSTLRTVLAAAGLIGAGGLLQPATGRVLEADEAVAGGRDAETEDAAAAESAAGARPPVDEGGDWPQHGAGTGNAAHLPHGVAPTGDVSEAWRYRNDRYHEGVAVVDGTVYVGGKSLAAVDGNSGTERWRYEPTEPDGPGDQEGDTPEFGTPAVCVDEGKVYASVGFGVYDGGVPGEMLVAVDEETGEERWRYDPADSEVLSAPTVYGGTAELGTADDEPADGEPADGEVSDGGAIYTRDGDAVHALAPDGSVRWTQSVNDGGSTYDPVPAAGGLVFATGAAGVRALDAGTGDVAWTALDGGDLSRGPAAVVAAGRLHVGRLDDAAATLVALGAGAGEERWRTT